MRDEQNPESGRLSKPPDRIAVIAVHGVGDPQPGDSARNIAALLQSSSANRSERYSTFIESPLEISVSTARLAGNPEPIDTKFSYRAMNNIADIEKVRRYRTYKLSGERVSPQDGAKRVDVYEMYWGDLSRGSSMTIRFLSELYQILFHLASLGRKTVIAAAKEVPSGKRGFIVSALGPVHRAIELLLPAAIPMANLFLLVPAMALLALFIPESARQPIASFCSVLVVLGIACGIFFARKCRYCSALAVAAAGGVGAAVAMSAIDSYSLLAYASMALGLILAFYGSRILLDRYRSWIKNWATGTALAIAIGLYGLAFYFSEKGLLTTQEGILSLSVFVLHALFFLLQLMWAAAFVLFFLAFFLPFGARGAEMQAARTGRIGVLISATLFLILTILLWSSFLHQVNSKSQSILELPIDIPISIPLLYADSFCSLSSTSSLGAYTECLFLLTTGATINFFIALVGVALLLAIACVLPSAWFEARPFSGSAAQGGGATERLRIWLDDSRVVLLIGEIFLVLAWLVLAAGYWPEIIGITNAGDISGNWVRTAGGLLAAFIPIAVILRGQLPKVLGVVLDIALDVSNWLKERPMHTNPRGRIFFRYLALLKEIIASRQYDRIVIVSHSQGTVITADLFKLLREINAWPFNQKDRREIVLLTAGSPLRQLYAARFPHWYGWVNNNPAPQTLGMETWINIYRSGDYVGRKLWDKDDVAADAVRWGVPHQDVLIGLGAHTHYFDHTAPEPRAIIDWLISHPSPDAGNQMQSDTNSITREIRPAVLQENRHAT